MTPYYESGGITLHHGDNVEILRSFPSESIDLTVTSPPYDSLRTYGGHEWGWDEFVQLAPELFRVTKQGGVVVWIVNDATVDGSETGTSFRQALHFKECGFRLHDTMIWHKTNALPLNNNRYEPSFEFMFILSRDTPSVWNPVKRPSKLAGIKATGTQVAPDGKRVQKWGNGRTYNDESVLQNIWSTAVGTTNGSHPAIFPESLARDHILSWSNEGDIILDPFNGSGTTTKMAKHMGRKAIGIEINADYLPIQVNRLRQEVFAFD